MPDDSFSNAYWQEVQRYTQEAERLNRAGLQQFQTNQIEAAIQTWQQVLEICRAIAQREGEGATCLNLGFAYQHLNQYAQALSHYQQALSVLREVGDRPRESVALQNMGLIYTHLNQYAQALAQFEAALAIAQATGDHVGVERILTNINQIRQASGSANTPLANTPSANRLDATLSTGPEAANRRQAVTMLNHIGLAYHRNQQYAPALEQFQQALGMAQQDGNQQGAASSLHNIGLVYDSLKQYSTALQHYQQAFAMARAAGDRIGEVATLNHIGQVYVNLGQYPQALESLQQALVMAGATGDRAREAEICFFLGITYANLGQFSEAIQHYQQALLRYQELRNRLLQGNVLSLLAVAYQNLQRYPQALAAYEQALSFVREQGDRAREGQILLNMAAIYKGLEQPSEAINVYSQALVIYQGIGDLTQVSTIVNNIGNLLGNLGQYTQAIEQFQQALTLADKIGDRAQECFILSNLSAMFAYLGQSAQALQHSQQALTIAQKLKDNAQTAIVLNTIGGIYRNLGQYSLALDHFQQALTLLRQIGDRTQEGTILNNIGSIYLNLKQYPQALVTLQDALAVHQEMGNRIPIGVTLNNIGAIYLDIGDPARAFQFHQQALVVAREAGDRSGEWFALNNIGTAHMYLKQYSEALQYLQEGLAIARAIGDRAGQSATLTNMGIALFKDGQILAAEDTLYSTLEILETLRQAELADTNKVSLFETQLKAYQFLQQVLVSQSSSEKILKALEVAERGRARAFVELLANQLSDQRAKELIASAPTITQIQQIAQQQNAILVQYSVINVGVSHPLLYVWVVQPTGDITFRQVDLANLDQPLSELVQMGRAIIGARGRKQASGQLTQAVTTSNAEQIDSPQFIVPLQQLYDVLIQPIRDQFPTDASNRIIFIPQSELFLVPFAALQDEQGTFLIQHHTILIAPSIQVLAIAYQRRQELSLHNQAAIDPEAVLVVGNPTMPTSAISPLSPQSLPPLPEAQREAEEIASLFNAQVYIGANATKTIIIQKMFQARLIHLATHGLLEYGVSNASGIHQIPGALAFAPDPQAITSTAQNGLLTATEIAELTLKAELVVLSACDTGRGVITGDGVIGLSRSFIAAGVPSVIVSLWKVPDDSTAHLMTQLYRNLQHQTDKSQALRQAMLSTMQRYPNPLYWAAFTLVGQAD